MALISREFMICDRCFLEVQVYELDDEGTMSNKDWSLVNVESARRNFHLCPECSADVIKLLNTLPPTSSRAHLAEAQKHINKED